MKMLHYITQKSIDYLQNYPYNARFLSLC